MPFTSTAVIWCTELGRFGSPTPDTLLRKQLQLSPMHRHKHTLADFLPAVQCAINCSVQCTIACSVPLPAVCSVPSPALCHHL